VVSEYVDVTKPVGPNNIFFHRRHTHPDHDWRDPHKALDWSKVYWQKIEQKVPTMLAGAIRLRLKKY